MTKVVVFSAGPDWASIMTAIGTVAVAAVAVGVALFAEWRADKWVAGERRHSAAQLQEERKHSAAQLAGERRIAQEREQLTEAYAVQVLMGERDTGEVADRTTGQPVPLRRVAAIIINHGRYTITHIAHHDGMPPARTPLRRRGPVPGYQATAGARRIAGAKSEQRLAVGGGNAWAAAWWLGGRTGLERRLDGGGDELRGLRVDSDIPAKQHPADDLPGVPGHILRLGNHVSPPC